MFSQQLKNISAFIKKHNPFFQTGFHFAWQDEETGYIWARDGADRKPIFPDDRFGDYFYLRVIRNGKIEDDPMRFPSMGCTKPGVMINTTVRLVPVVQNADADLLLQRLVNCLGLYSGEIRLSSFNWDADTVTLNEMSRAADEEVMTALQRIKRGMAIVAIDFQLSLELPFKNLNCLPEICEPC